MIELLIWAALLLYVLWRLRHVSRKRVDRNRAAR